jgi:hypothetical protein
MALASRTLYLKAIKHCGRVRITGSQIFKLRKEGKTIIKFKKKQGRRHYCNIP